MFPTTIQCVEEIFWWCWRFSSVICPTNWFSVIRWHFCTTLLTGPVAWIGLVCSSFGCVFWLNWLNRLYGLRWFRWQDALVLLTRGTRWTRTTCWPCLVRPNAWLLASEQIKLTFHIHFKFQFLYENKLTLRRIRKRRNVVHPIELKWFRHTVSPEKHVIIGDNFNKGL